MNVVGILDSPKNSETFRGDFVENVCFSLFCTNMFDIMVRNYPRSVVSSPMTLFRILRTLIYFQLVSR